VNAEVTTAGALWLRFLSGPDIDSFGLSYAEIVAAAGPTAAHCPALADPAVPGVSTIEITAKTCPATSCEFLIYGPLQGLRG